MHLSIDRERMTIKVPKDKLTFLSTKETFILLQQSLNYLDHLTRFL